MLYNNNNLPSNLIRKIVIIFFSQIFEIGNPWRTAYAQYVFKLRVFIFTILFVTCFSKNSFKNDASQCHKCILNQTS